MKRGERLAGRWTRAARAGTVIDLQADLMRFTVDAIAGPAFGTDVNTLESDDDIIQRHLDKIFPRLSTRIIVVPYWRFFKLPSDRKLDRALQTVNAAIDGFIANAPQQLAADPARRRAPQNLLQAMLVAADQHGSGIDDAQLPLQALMDTVVGDMALPGGTVAMSLLRHDCIDDAFVPEGLAFKPERWLGEEGKSPGSAKRISMPFGAGPRICPRRYLALQEMKMVLLTLLTHFDIDFVATADGSEPAERLMFAMAQVGLQMWLRARS